ncbi:MAG: thioredoxin domain-containing protein, partial [Betaproteobacteria bacterium]|nr:thioredoxin domain-containing protein [Betaproteobacteria bacterium]
AFKPLLDRQASAHASLCLALEEQLAPPTIVILRGDGVAAWQRELCARYLPQTMVLAIPAGAGALPPVLDKPAGGKVNAWVCHGVKCLAPITELAELVAVLTEPAA